MQRKDESIIISEIKLPYMRFPNEQRSKQYSLFYIVKIIFM